MMQEQQSLGSASHWLGCEDPRLYSYHPKAMFMLSSGSWRSMRHGLKESE